MKNKITKLLLFVLSAVSIFLVNPNKAQAAPADPNTDFVQDIPPEKGAGPSKKILMSDPVTKKNLTHSKVNMIVVLIQFPKSENDPTRNTVNSSTEYTSETISNIKSSFDAGKNTNSLADYIRKISYDKCNVNPVFTFSAKTGTATYIYTANHIKEYYSPYKSNTNEEGYTSDNESERRFELVKSAFAKIKTRIPSNLNLDLNEDGYIDAVDFFVPYETNWSNILWSHKSSVAKTTACSINSKYLHSYNLITYPSFNRSKYRVLSHEFLHTLGYPDMYNYNNSSLTYNLWTMMDNNIGYPTVHERQKYGNWITDDEIKTISSSGNYSLYAPIYENKGIKNKAYKVTIPYSNEYFLIEYRGAAASEYESLYGTSGIVVSRINPSVNGNAGNAVEVYNMRTSTATNTTTSLSKLSSTSYNTVLDLITSDGKKTDYSVQLTSKSNKMAYFNLINHTDNFSISLDSSATDEFNVGTSTKITANILPNCPYTLKNMNVTIKRAYDIQLATGREKSETILNQTTTQNYIKFAPSTYGKYTIDISATNIFGKTAYSTIVLYVSDPAKGQYVNKPKTISIPKFDIKLPKIIVSPNPIEPIIKDKIKLN